MCGVELDGRRVAISTGNIGFLDENGLGHGRGEHALVNLREDPGETRNLAHEPSSRGVLADMQEHVARWQKQTGDGIRIIRSDDSGTTWSEPAHLFDGGFWMTSNLATHSQDMDMADALKNNPRFKGRKSIRRVLALFCSFDALNWLPAGYVIVWPLMRQASNYCGLLIDGDDLLVAARTARNAPNQHDNDLITFHRLSSFRERAAMLLPGEE